MAKWYPREQKEAALRFLQAHKEALRVSLGFKRLSWTTIRNRIMEPYEIGKDGRRLKDDDRLYRQIFEAWERGGNISDDLFELIDNYLRRLAAEAKDGDAIKILRNWDFVEQAGVLAKMYMPSALINSPNYKMPWKCPWTAYSEPVGATWFKSIVFKSDISHLGIERLLVGYLQKPIEEIDVADFDETVVFEGFLIPTGLASSGYKGRSFSQGVILKLLRPEFRGSVALGSAEGELSLREEGNGRLSLIADLDYPSPIICPTVGRHWQEMRYFDTKAFPRSSLIHIEDKAFYEVRDLPKQDIYRLPIHFDEKFDITINALLNSVYKGYVY